jgi:hypothetical protein
MPSDFSDEENLDAEMIAEELTGKVEPKTPEQGIADMRQRLRLLRGRRKILENLDHPDDDFKITRLLQYDREIADAKARLREYQTQLSGRN